MKADLTITGRRVIGCLMGKGTNGARAVDLASELGAAELKQLSRKVLERVRGEE